MVFNRTKDFGLREMVLEHLPDPNTIVLRMDFKLRDGTLYNSGYEESHRSPPIDTNVPDHFIPTNSLNASSDNTVTPKPLAFSNFEPAFSPATT